MAVTAKYTDITALMVSVVCTGVAYTIPVEAIIAKDGRIPAEMLAWLNAGNTIPAYAAAIPSQADLYAYATQKRYNKMTGGIVWNGVTISTTDDAAGRIKNKRDLIRDGQATEPFNMVVGSTTISASLALMNTLVKAVGDHWQACFDTQSTVNAGIAVGTITTPAQIDAAFV